MSTYLNNKLHLQLTAPPSLPGMDFNDDDVLQKRFREMKQYEEAKLRINLRFLADRRTLVALLVIFFALSCDRPSWTRPSSVLHGLFSRAATEGTSRRGIANRAGGRSTPRSRRRGGVMFETLVGSEDFTTNIQKARQGRFSNDRSDRQAF